MIGVPFTTKKILEVAAYRASPKFYDTLKSGWPYHTKMWYRWSRDVEQLWKVLSFRKTMVESLG